jgi:hypothetical protein
VVICLLTKKGSHALPLFENSISKKTSNLSSNRRPVTEFEGSLPRSQHPDLEPILSPINPAIIHTTSFFQTHFNINPSVYALSKRSLPFHGSWLEFFYAFPVFQECYMPHQSHAHFSSI